MECDSSQWAVISQARDAVGETRIVTRREQFITRDKWGQTIPTLPHFCLDPAPSSHCRK